MSEAQPNIFSLDGRLESFKKAKWPHNGSPNGGSKKSLLSLRTTKKHRATAQIMANAGFYAKPIDRSIDNACCGYCRKNLDGWEETDVPWEEHKAHSPACPLACLHDELSRELTFTLGGWKHGGSISAGNMSKAGFFYWPKLEDIDQDDTAICVQCGLALDGWEPNDNPRYEHSRRRPKCPILVSGLIKSPAHFELLLASLPTEGAIREFEENPQAALLELCKTPVNTLKDKAGPSTTRKSAIKKLKKSPQTTTEDSSKPVEKPSAVSHQQPATASKQVAKPNFVAPIPQQPKFKMPPSKIAPIPVVFKELTVPETPLKVNSITKVSSGKVLSARRKTATDNTTPANLRRSSRIRTSAIMQSEVTNSRLSLGLNFESIQATPLTKRKRIIGKSSIPETPIAISPSKFSTDSRSKRLEDALTEVSAHMTIEKCDLEKPVCEFLQSLIDRKMRAFDEAVERHQESLLILVNE